MRTIWKTMIPGSRMSQELRIFSFLFPTPSTYHWCYPSCPKMATAAPSITSPQSHTQKQKGRDMEISLAHVTFLWGRKMFPRYLQEDFPYLSLARIGSCDHPSHCRRLENQDSGIFSQYLRLGSIARRMRARRAAEWATDLPCRLVLRNKCEKNCRNTVEELIPSTTHV